MGHLGSSSRTQPGSFRTSLTKTSSVHSPSSSDQGSENSRPTRLRRKRRPLRRGKNAMPQWSATSDAWACAREGSSFRTRPRSLPRLRGESNGIVITADGTTWTLKATDLRSDQPGLPNSITTNRLRDSRVTTGAQQTSFPLRSALLGRLAVCGFCGGEARGGSPNGEPRTSKAEPNVNAEP